MHTSTLMGPKRIAAGLVLPLVCAGLVGLLQDRPASAEAGDEADARSRCAARLSIALLGQTPSPTLAAAPNPLTQVDGLLETPAFVDRFSSFLNAEFNAGPSEEPIQDVVYFMSKFVLEKNKPWKEMFVGHYDMYLTPDKQGLDVVDFPNGLGYFRTLSWMRRYAGNEGEGLRISAAHRMIRNTTGTEIVPSVGKPDDDRTVVGRKGAACKGCHFDEWYALDTSASVLTRKLVDANGNVTFSATPAAGPQQLLGKTISNDREFVEALVDSEHWRFAQCRYVFKFLFGRSENTCEAALFDKCVDTLTSKGTIKAAIAVVAKDPLFCQ